ncbi:MAG: beta-glucosidase [Lachnospiraceae bacterium]|nr:beta-glucosidase [Lachnospiraceae bacterium]
MEYHIDPEKAIVNYGDPKRIRAVMQRAQEGKPVTLAFLGGSITQGYHSSVHDKCYAKRIHSWWQERFPQSQTTYVNAGIGGTTSQYGVARVDADVMAYRPDVVFVEFSVNDEGNEFFRETYESLIRHILSYELSDGERSWKPAVLIIHTIKYDDGICAEDWHLTVGKHYALPCVSMRASLYAAMKEGHFNSRDITQDDLHPNDEGHGLMADMVTHCLEKIAQEPFEASPVADTLPAPLTAVRYEQTERLQHINSNPGLKGFQKDLLEKQYDTDCFRGGWAGYKAGDEITFTFRGTELAIQYRRTVRRPALIAEVIIDDNEAQAVILDSNFDQDWGDCLSITTVMRHGKVVTGQSKPGSTPATYAGSGTALARLAEEEALPKEHKVCIRILGTPEELGWEILEMEKDLPAWMKTEEKGERIMSFDLVSVITAGDNEKKSGFPKDFVWGAASSAYQVEGTDPDDGRGKCVWDTYTEEKRTADGHDAQTSCDHIHHYKEDFRLMAQLGIKHYRFSVSWSRIMPEGRGRVNQKAIDMYRDMIMTMKENGITPYLTMFHWETPQELEYKGGWLNPEIVDDFEAYAKVIAENFTDICDYFITLNEPECFTGLGYSSGVHAPAKKLSLKDTFRIVHNALKAHGKAVITLRKYAKKEIKIGYAPTCTVAIPCTESPADIEAARKVYFGLNDPNIGWTWNVAWFSDPVFLGHYPEEGLQKYKDYLPEITEEDMQLIHQPLDFMGHNIYNGYFIREGKDGKPEYVQTEDGFPITASKWPIIPSCLYWGAKFLCERYHLPLYITENGASCADNMARDGGVHDTERIEFLDAYLGEVQRAVQEGIDLRGYFLWTFLDNFEWEKGYQERFGIVWVDFKTQKRVAKDSALWYRDVIESNGAILSVNEPPKSVMFLNGDTVEGGYFNKKTVETLIKETPQLFGNPTAEEAERLLKAVNGDAASKKTIAVSGTAKLQAVTSSYVLLEVAEGDGMIGGYQIKTGTKMLLPCGMPECRVSGEMKLTVVEV